MKFNIDEALELLSRTPGLLKSLLKGLPDHWIVNNEGAETWSPYDVIGHLIHGERTDWITRAKVILDHGENHPFEPFDRFAQFEASRGKTVDELLEEFALRREESIKIIRELNLTERDLEKRGTHPELGQVTLGELLATWVVHDLDHIGQIARTMARQYETEVGPWKAYLSILQQRR